MRATSPYSGAQRSASVKLYRSVSTSDVVDGVAVALIDLTELSGSITTTDNSCTIKLSFDTELFSCSVQPRPSDILSVEVDGALRSVTIVDSISDFIEERGVRSMTVKGRTREGISGWKDLNSTSPNFGVGTNYRVMMELICSQLMLLNEKEYAFLDIDYACPHWDFQFANEPPWGMLTSIAYAAGMEVFVDVLCRVRTFSVDTLRTRDIQVSNDGVVSFKTSRQTNASGTSSIRLAWIDPQLKKQYQANQVLGTETLTAGFFKHVVKRKVYFSSDRTQRAEDTYMKIIDSCNSGLLGDVVDEEYVVKDIYHGEIVLTTPYWIPILYTVSLMIVLASSYAVPDEAQVDPVSHHGFTIPRGRLLEKAAMLVILGTMMAIGTGTYEVWGQPYDYVHAKNYTIARAGNLPYYAISQTEVESSLIISEDHAKSLAIKQLLYLHASNYSMEFTLVDDSRIEKGDILLFEDGSRVMVMGFSNDFTRGAQAEIQVSGVLL